jgi:hypothetical protein
MAKERMTHLPVSMTPSMINVVIEAITSCIQRSGGRLTVVAASIESTHMHLLIPYVSRDIEITANSIADQTPSPYIDKQIIKVPSGAKASGVHSFSTNPIGKTQKIISNAIMCDMGCHKHHIHFFLHRC